jgi:hypothetical protein
LAVVERAGASGRPRDEGLIEVGLEAIPARSLVAAAYGSRSLLPSSKRRHQALCGRCGAGLMEIR